MGSHLDNLGLPSSKQGPSSLMQWFPVQEPFSFASLVYLLATPSWIPSKRTNIPDKRVRWNILVEIEDTFGGKKSEEIEVRKRKLQLWMNSTCSHGLGQTKRDMVLRLSINNDLLNSNNHASPLLPSNYFQVSTSKWTIVSTTSKFMQKLVVF